ncbi:hydroxyisourate hydrolase, partial [Escherichia coli]|uniref:hydroxyisourate hydrolase n=1 Tax=Escherichia coli TaxID=562 RepID=UPI0006B4EDFD
MKKTASLLMLTTLAFAPAAFSAPAGTLSVHILDQQTGMPPSDVTVTLEKQQQDKWTPIASGKTDHDGRIKSLYPEDQDMQPGVYKVAFKTADYGTVAKLAMRQPFVLFKGLTFQKLCLPG